jgi:pimeloyl-ACP methyl ester carboxylesterase
MKNAIIGLLAAVTLAGSATASSPRFREIKLATGVRLHYAEEGPANGKVIIMLHGLSDSWFSFSKVMPLLSDGYRIYALDLRGHGNSDRPASGYHTRDLAADVIAFMDAKKIASATIVGHSMGSFIAQYVALAAPKRVERMILIGSARSPAKFVGMADFVDAIDKLPEPVPYEFARDFQVSTIHHPVGDAFLKTAIDESLKLPLRVWRELGKGLMTTEAPTALGRYGIPTLIIRGEKDTYAVEAEQEPLRAMIGTAKRKEYKETGHAVHWERPVEFARDVKMFMKEK